MKLAGSWVHMRELMGMKFLCHKSKRVTFQHTHHLPQRTDGVVCVHAHRRPGYYGRGARLPDSFDHAEAHFNAAVGVVLAGLRKP